jgi:hypothetical protein
MASSLHQDMSARRTAQCVFGSAKINLTIRENSTLGQLAAIAVDWTKQRGQGTQWQIEGNQDEAVDFEFEYPIVPIPEEEEVTI